MVDKIGISPSDGFKEPGKATHLDKVSGNTPADPQKMGTYAKGETVSLTNANLAKLESELSQTPAFDATRVEKIKSAILDGSYKVDLTSTAKAMVDTENLLKDVN